MIEYTQFLQFVIGQYREAARIAQSLGQIRKSEFYFGHARAFEISLSTLNELKHLEDYQEPDDESEEAQDMMEAILNARR